MINRIPLTSIVVLVFLLVGGVLICDGPDGYGYIETEDSTFNWIEVSNIGDSISLGDDDFVSIDLPFFFPFYNRSLNRIFLISNGLLSDTNYFESRNYSLPCYEISNLIAPLWIDLAPNQGGQIFTYTDSNQFIVEWRHVPVYRSPNDNTFEVILKSDGQIIFQYLHVDPQFRDTATVGIQGNYGQGNFYLMFSYGGTPHQLHDSLRIVFRRPEFDHDVGIFYINPVDNEIFEPSDSIQPSLYIKNYGENPENVNIGLQISLNDSVVQSYSGNTTMSPGTVLCYSFPWFHFTESGKYNLSFIVHSPYDQVPSNDSFECSLYCAEAVETFEDSAGGFKTISSSGWEWGTPLVGPDSIPSGTKLWGTVLDGNYYDNSNMILESPEYTVTGSHPAFGFFHWYHMERRWDGGNVLISTDFGRTWNIIEPVGGYPYQFIQALSYQPGFSGRSNNWESVRFNLPLSAGQHVRIRLHLASGSGVNYEGWYMDNFWTIGLEPYNVHHDVGPVKIITPSGFTSPNTPIAVLGVVENFGIIADSFNVTFIIVDTLTDDTIFRENRTAYIQPGETQNLSFGSVTLQDSSYYKEIMVTELSNDENPSNDTLISFARTGIAVGDMRKFIPLDPVTGDFQNLGVTTDGEYFYITGGNRDTDPNKLYILDSTGIVLNTLCQPDQFTGWGLSDLTFNGMNFYACYGHYIYRLSVENGNITALDSIEGPLRVNRALTIDPRTKHLYVANGTEDIYCIDSTGNILYQWSNSLNIQGVAFDTTSGKLWLSVARSDSNIIYEFDPANGTLTGKTFTVPLPPGYNHGLAGRMTFLISPNGTKNLVELVQGDPTDYLAFIYLGQTGVKETDNFEGISRIFSTPAIVFKNISVSVITPCELTLYSSDGRVVKREKVSLRFINIPVFDLRDGVYFLQGKTCKKRQIERLIILK